MGKPRGESDESLDGYMTKEKEGAYICSYLYAVISSGFLSADQLKEQILSMIEAIHTEDIPNWALDIVTMTDENEIRDKLFEYAYYENYNVSGEYSLYDIILGYRYKMYSEGMMDINTFIEHLLIHSEDMYSDIAAYYSTEEQTVFDITALNCLLGRYCFDYTSAAEKQLSVILDFFNVKNSFADY